MWREISPASTALRCRIYNASFFTSAPFYVGSAWLDQPDAVLLGGGGAVATALVLRLQVHTGTRCFTVHVYICI